MLEKNKKILHKKNILLLKKTKKAFTVVEMLVVVGIFLLITSIILFNSKSFSQNASLQNTIQDTALSIRKAQGYALGFESPSVPFGQSLAGFGVYFGNLSSVTWQKKYIIFGDFSGGGGGEYSTGGTSCGFNTLTPSDECIEQIPITTSDKISNICLSYNGTSKGMSSSTTGTSCVGSNDEVTIFFNRPNPDANFCWFKSTNSNNCVNKLSGNPISDASLEIISISGKKKVVTVWNTGQIAIN